jgi:hypothetical protein
MVAIFPEKISEEQLSTIKKFFLEGTKAQDYWQKNRGKKPQEFWPGFREQFPTVCEYLGRSDGDCHNSLAGQLDFGFLGNIEHELGLARGNILSYSAEVWHMADWGPLAEFMKKKFGAKDVLTASEEDGGTDLASQLLHEYDSKELVTEYQELRRQVASVKTELQTLYNSCIEGHTGAWDCSTAEGREGFLAMAQGVKKIAKTLKIKEKE